MIRISLVFILNTAIFLCSLMVIIWTCGIVWRVEKKLDFSYKLHLISAIAFAFSATTGFWTFKNADQEVIVFLIFQLIFILFLLFGTLEMRMMLRKLDGEIK